MTSNQCVIVFKCYRSLACGCVACITLSGNNQDFIYRISSKPLPESMVKYTYHHLDHLKQILVKFESKYIYSLHKTYLKCRLLNASHLWFNLSKVKLLVATVLSLLLGSFTSSMPRDAYMGQCRSSLVQIKVCRLFGAKPLSEPTEACCYCKVDP